MSPAIILTGPTATGKTALALRWAKQYSPLIEIINADTLLMVRGFNIGSAKPSAEEQQRIPHHLIDIRDPDQAYTAGDFVRDVQERMNDIHSRNKKVLIVGGSGFYLKALIYGLWPAPPTDEEFRKTLEKFSNLELFEKLELSDPTTAQRVGQNDRYRLIRALEIIHTSESAVPSLLEKAHSSRPPDPRFKLWVIDRNQEELETRIRDRTRLMIQEGLVAEVEYLRKTYPDARALQSVGYRQVVAYLEGQCPPGRKIAPGLPGLQSEIELATRQLVKSQRTWFKGQKHAQWYYLDRDLEQINRDFDESMNDRL